MKRPPAQDDPIGLPIIGTFTFIAAPADPPTCAACHEAFSVDLGMPVAEDVETGAVLPLCPACFVALSH